MKKSANENDGLSPYAKYLTFMQSLGIATAIALVAGATLGVAAVNGIN